MKKLTNTEIQNIKISIINTPDFQERKAKLNEQYQFDKLDIDRAYKLVNKAYESGNKDSYVLQYLFEEVFGKCYFTYIWDKRREERKRQEEERHKLYLKEKEEARNLYLKEKEEARNLYHFEKMDKDSAFKAIKDLGIKRRGESVLKDLYNEIFNADYNMDYLTFENEEHRKKQEQERKEEDRKKKLQNTKEIFVIFTIVGLIIFCFFWACSSCGSHSENYNDGSSKHCAYAYYTLEEQIKANMNDPDSYEKINYASKYNPEAKCYFVTVQYRGKNIYGGTVTETVIGTVSIDDTGNATVLEMAPISY